MLAQHFKKLYQRTLIEAHTRAHAEILAALENGGRCLDCGAHKGDKYDFLSRTLGLEKSRYQGIEWSDNLVEICRGKSLNVVQGDLNKKMESRTRPLGAFSGCRSWSTC